MKKILIALCLFMIFGCANKPIVDKDKWTLIKENIVEIELKNENTSIILDEETQAKLIEAFNKISTKIQNVNDNTFTNQFIIKSEKKEMILSYNSIGTIHFNEQIVDVPLDSDLYDLIRELENNNQGFKTSNMMDILPYDGIYPLNNNYAIISPEAWIDDIFIKLNIETDECFDISAYELLTKSKYSLNETIVFNNMELKVLEISDGEIGAMLFHWK